MSKKIKKIIVTLGLGLLAFQTVSAKIITTDTLVCQKGSDVTDLLYYCESSNARPACFSISEAVTRNSHTRYFYLEAVIDRMDAGSNRNHEIITMGTLNNGKAARVDQVISESATSISYTNIIDVERGAGAQTLTTFNKQTNILEYSSSFTPKIQFQCQQVQGTVQIPL
jgi:predicted transposase YbfD/YdcC